MKILMAAPYDSKGRYKGGIMYVANSIYTEVKKGSIEDFEIDKFETCRIERSGNTSSRIKFENLINFFHMYKDIIKELKISKAEVLYFHSSVKKALLKDLLAIRRAKINAKIKTVLHIHFAEYSKIMFKNTYLNNLIIKTMNKYVDRIIFLSKITADEFVKQGLRESKVKVIYNFHTINYTDEQIQKKVENMESKKSIDMLFIGSIDKRKGIIDVLKILKEIEGITFHICGSFNSPEIEKEFKAELNLLKSKTIYHGYIDGKEKERLLLNSDILILPSYSEGLPIVIMEAFGAGCSLITTNVGAIPEIFQENSGFMINPGDRYKLRNCIQSVINDRESCREYMLYNYKYGRNFSIDKFINHIFNLCNEVIE